MPDRATRDGVKGAGALVRIGNLPIEPVLFGGGQEDGLRSGTENPFAIAAFAHAARLSVREHQAQRAEREASHQRWLAFLAGFSRIRVFRSEAETPYIINFQMTPIPGEVILHHLEAEGLLVSTGSACSTRKPEPSPVLLAAGFTEQEALSSIRLSFSLFNPPAETEIAFSAFKKAMEKLERL